MKAWDVFKDSNYTQGLKLCPKCSSDPVLRKAPDDWAFSLSCPNGCASKTTEMVMTRSPDPEEIYHTYHGHMRNLAAWWEAL